jgi:hypothetical protein
MDASGTNEDIQLVESRRGTEDITKEPSSRQIETREERDLISIEHREEHSKPVGTSFFTKSNIVQIMQQQTKAIGTSIDSKSIPEELREERPEAIRTRFISESNRENFQTGELIGGQIQPTEKVEVGEAIGNRRNEMEDNKSVSNKRLANMEKPPTPCRPKWRTPEGHQLMFGQRLDHLSVFIE